MSFHYYGSTNYNWATASTEQEVLARLARYAGASLVKRCEGGMNARTCRVELPESAQYTIRNYTPCKRTEEAHKGERVPCKDWKSWRIHTLRRYEEVPDTDND